MNLLFEGKVAIVTGATSGIGKAAAKELALSGATIFLCGRNSIAAEEFQEELMREGALAKITCGDLTNSDYCRCLVSECIKEFGRVDVLVNAAGVIHREDILSTTNAQWNETIATNLTAPFLISRAAMPALIESRGNIVNVASDWGVRGGIRALAYCASKGGLILMTKAMARDHAHQGVRINAVCPGDTATPMLDRELMITGAVLGDLENDIPMGRVAKPEEVAAGIRFLASAAAGFITGATLMIDGGSSA